MSVRNPAIRKKMERAEREVRVSRIIADDAHPEWKDRKCVRRHCFRPAAFFVVRQSDECRYSICHGCLWFFLDELLLAPMSEYLEEEAKLFERGRYRMRRSLHNGCDGRSSLDKDGFCQRSVECMCSRCGELDENGKQRMKRLCATHARTHRYHGDLEWRVPIPEAPPLPIEAAR